MRYTTITQARPLPLTASSRLVLTCLPRCAQFVVQESSGVSISAVDAGAEWPAPLSRQHGVYERLALENISFNAGPCDYARYIYGGGAEWRGVQRDAAFDAKRWPPTAAWLTAETPTLWGLNLHVIDLRGVVDVRNCVQCTCAPRPGGGVQCCPDRCDDALRGPSPATLTRRFGAQVTLQHRHARCRRRAVRVSLRRDLHKRHDCSAEHACHHPLRADHGVVHCLQWLQLRRRVQPKHLRRCRPGAAWRVGERVHVRRQHHAPCVPVDDAAQHGHRPALCRWPPAHRCRGHRAAHCAAWLVQLYAAVRLAATLRRPRLRSLHERLRFPRRAAAAARGHHNARREQISRSC